LAEDKREKGVTDHEPGGFFPNLHGGGRRKGGKSDWSVGIYIKTPEEEREKKRWAHPLFSCGGVRWSQGKEEENLQLRHSFTTLCSFL